MDIRECKQNRDLAVLLTEPGEWQQEPEVSNPHRFHFSPTELTEGTLLRQAMGAVPILGAWKKQLSIISTPVSVVVKCNPLRYFFWCTMKRKDEYNEHYHYMHYHTVIFLKRKAGAQAQFGILIFCHQFANLYYSPNYLDKYSRTMTPSDEFAMQSFIAMFSYFDVLIIVVHIVIVGYTCVICFIVKV